MLPKVHRHVQFNIFVGRHRASFGSRWRVTELRLKGETTVASTVHAAEFVFFYDFGLWGYSLHLKPALRLVRSCQSE